MGSTPLIRGHNPKSYAMNSYIIKDLKIKCQNPKMLNLERKNKTRVWKDTVSRKGYSFPKNSFYKGAHEDNYYTWPCISMASTP
jgi:hypothetical protein